MVAEMDLLFLTACTAAYCLSFERFIWSIL